MPATQYHVWVDLRPEASDVAFADAVHAYMERLQVDGFLQSWRLSRRKLGLGPATLGEFHIVMEFAEMADLDELFEAVSERADPLEGLHHAVNSKAQNFTAALYRDFPDAHRQRGEERF